MLRLRAFIGSVVGCSTLPFRDLAPDVGAGQQHLDHDCGDGAARSLAYGRFRRACSADMSKLTRVRLDLSPQVRRHAVG